MDKNDDVLPMQTVYANESVKAPSGRHIEQIKELDGITNKTNQTSKIMNFPPHWS